MDHIDEFESVFRRAEKEQLAFVDIPIESIAFVVDGGHQEAAAAIPEIKKFLCRLENVPDWRVISGEQYQTVDQLLGRIDEHRTDLIITYRHLQEASMIPQHSLGVYLDVLTQTTSIPVLVLPGTASAPAGIQTRVCDRVMVIADHIHGDNRLINYGARMCSVGGTMWLCHVEDDRIFERYMQAIERIPEIDSDQARVLIDRQLLGEARDFVEGCAVIIQEEGPGIHVENYVGRGHHLQDYRRLIDEQNIDLLVLNTKDDDQLAMHGRAYSVSVELTDVSMLLL
jgi:hypothetical protein